MNNSDRTLRLAALLVATAVAVLWSACGGPKVESTSIDGRVRQIDNWSIEWVGDITITLDSVALRWLTEKRSKYTESDFCLAFVSDVRNKLVSDYELPMYENLPMTGRIEISLIGVKRKNTQSVDTDAKKVIEDVVHDGSQGVANPFWFKDPLKREALYFRTVDLVRQANVRIIDLNGMLLAEIRIGNEEGGKIKPKHVANAIASAIKGGRVKPAPGPE